MKNLQFSSWVYLDSHYPNILVRVRWLGKSRTTYFSVGCKVERDKWDSVSHRARINTIHKVGSDSLSAHYINARIEKTLEFIDAAFLTFHLRHEIPTVEQLRLEYQRISKGEEKPHHVNKTLSELFEQFLNEFGDERNLSHVMHIRYTKIYQQLIAFDPTLELETISKETMIGLKNWYIKNEYRNITIAENFKHLKTILRWFKSQGYNVPENVLTYRLNLKQVPKTVTFLNYKELIDFMNYKFPVEKNYLSRARDMFCFMAFTSLRYSDLKSLKKSAVFDDHLEVCTQKTYDSLRIPLVDQAKQILAKYMNSEYEGNYVFPVPSNQKLNEFLKDAAKIAGLDKDVNQTYFVGNTRHDETIKFYDQISCHDARRTFVCISLSLGIPHDVIMSCTGHADHKAMKPYIEVADETSKNQMAKWNSQGIKSDIVNRLEGLSTEQLIEVLKATLV